MSPALRLHFLLFLVLTGWSVPLVAGVTNPDISVLGQMRAFGGDGKDDPNRGRLQFSFDEAEIVADAYLNPYARGTFVFAVAEDGIEVEEGYFQIFRGLPKGLALKAGKYRVGFGRLNAVHPHAYPFIERFRVMQEYLPGEEAFNEIGAQLSYLIPVGGDVASTVSADALQGNSFHPEEPEDSRPAAVGRWTLFVPLTDPSALEMGASGAYGTNNVAVRTRSVLFGVDAKLKWWFNERSNTVVHGELFALDREDPLPEENGAVSVAHRRPLGGFVFTDFTLNKRYNVGAKYERFRRVEPDENGNTPWDQSAGIFAGLALMEETTLFRLNWDCFMPNDGEAVNTFTVQAVFSMGPHKPHLF
jgi:hypothetical protein